jgi:hypothetical protein
MAIATGIRYLRLQPLLLTCGGGVLLGATIWLWSHFGASVYLSYLAGAAFACI